jgi:glycylpeptide N-tetradecanoyltransferase
MEEEKKVAQNSGEPTVDQNQSSWGSVENPNKPPSKEQVDDMKRMQLM